MQVLAFQQLPDVGPDLVQVILHRVELHHGRLEHGLIQLHGVDAVILKQSKPGWLIWYLFDKKHYWLLYFLVTGKQRLSEK